MSRGAASEWLADLDPALAELDNIDAPCGAPTKTTGKPCKQKRAKGFSRCPVHLPDEEKDRYEAERPARQANAKAHGRWSEAGGWK